VTTDGQFMRRPKMAVGTEHRIYLESPVGSSGNPDAPPYATVEILAMGSSSPNEWTDDLMPAEGFRDLYSYAEWWDHWKANKQHLCKRWDLMQDEPFWTCWFRLKSLTPYFQQRLARDGHTQGARYTLISSGL
jgi:hypothetical protein